jgi:hypothetical protein
MLAKTAAVRSSGPGTTTAGTKPGLRINKPTTLRAWGAAVMMSYVERTWKAEQGDKAAKPPTGPSTNHLSEADRGSPPTNIHELFNPNSTEDISDRAAMYNRFLSVARHVTIPAAKCKSNFVARYFFPCLSDALNQPGKWTEDEEEEVVKWVAKGLTLMEKGGHT